MSDSLAGILPGTTTQADQWASGVAGSTGAALGTGTGAHGIVPAEGLIGGGVGTALNEVWEWLTTPFTQPMDTMTVFLIVGVVMVGIIVWSLFLYHIRIAAETI